MVHRESLKEGAPKMKITETRNENSMTLALEGRLDTVTAPQLEEVLKKNLPSVNELILDLEKLDYLSSAGLRMLLYAQMNIQDHGKLVIRHANNLVMGVFKVTGFVDILTIE